MFGRIGITKDLTVKIITLLVIASVFLLTMSILTDDYDSRKQISDDNGATEQALSAFLSDVEGIGKTSVMIRYGEENAVKGVIVSAEGAGEPVVKNTIVKGVATLFDIPVSSVMVFEKKQEESEE